MGKRSDLHELFKIIVPNVYFQPPPDFKMVYPCIVYKRDDITVRFADNTKYKTSTRYQATVIDRNPDSDIPDKVANLPLCSFERFFTTDGLNHDVFNLYF